MDMEIKTYAASQNAAAGFFVRYSRQFSNRPGTGIRWRRSNARFRPGSGKRITPTCAKKQPGLKHCIVLRSEVCVWG